MWNCSCMPSNKFFFMLVVVSSWHPWVGCRYEFLDLLVDVLWLDLTGSSSWAGTQNSSKCHCTRLCSNSLCWCYYERSYSCKSHFSFLWTPFDMPMPSQYPKTTGLLCVFAMSCGYVMNMFTVFVNLLNVTSESEPRNTLQPFKFETCHLI